MDHQVTVNYIRYSIMNSLIAKRYAKALYSLVIESKRLSEYEREIIHLYNACIENQQLHKLLINTTIHCNNKLIVLQKMISSSAILLLSFLRVLAKNKRIALLTNIFQEFFTLQRERRKELVITVISAVKLTKSNSVYVENVLKYFFHKKIIINSTVDKNILGGFIALTDNYLCDASLASKLARLARTSKLAIRNMSE